MGLIPTYLDFLGASYSPHEIKTATSSMPPDKALGLDGFKGAFFKSSWDIISYGRMHVITSFAYSHAPNFNILNSASSV